MSSFPLASVAAPDLSAEPEIVDGQRTYLVRARVPFVFSALLTDARIENRAKAKKADSEEPDSPTNPGDQKVVTKADGEGGEDTTDPASEGGEMGSESVLYGIASSTGVDTYGTEMSKRALDGMATQFSGGEVCYLPAHPSWSGNGEWDSVIGYVTKGEVVSGAVENAADGAEPGFVLRVEVTLDPCEMTERLCKRIEQKRKIGQSIGGWFTELRYIYAKDAGEWDPPERVIIEGVELDHLAATRRPSNGDSWIDGMRSAISTAHDLAVVRAKSKRSDAAEPAPAAEPSIDRNDTGPLDTENAPRHDSSDDAGREGHRASPGATEDGTPPPTPTEEPQMTEAELNTALSRALAPVVSRLDAVEARTAVATPPGERAAPAAAAKADEESVEVKALRERLAAVEQRSAASYFARKGHAGAGAFDRAVVENVAEQTLPTAPNLASVVRSKGFVERRDVDHYAAPAADITMMRANLESDLSALINSAVDDGVIREPNAEIGTWA